MTVTWHCRDRGEIGVIGVRAKIPIETARSRRARKPSSAGRGKARALRCTFRGYTRADIPRIAGRDKASRVPIASAFCLPLLSGSAGEKCALRSRAYERASLKRGLSGPGPRNSFSFWLNSVGSRLRSWCSRRCLRRDPRTDSRNGGNVDIDNSWIIRLNRRFEYSVLLTIKLHDKKW